VRLPRRGGQSQGEQDPHPRQQRWHVMGRAVRRVRQTDQRPTARVPTDALITLENAPTAFRKRTVGTVCTLLMSKAYFMVRVVLLCPYCPADLSGQLPSGSRPSCPRTLPTMTPVASSTYHQSLVSPHLLAVRCLRLKATAFGAVSLVLHPFFSRVLNSSQTTPAKRRVRTLPLDMTAPVDHVS
jgi:hypothetical protein